MDAEWEEVGRLPRHPPYSDEDRKKVRELKRKLNPEL
jgi:hypothetical protein